MPVKKIIKSEVMSIREGTPMRQMTITESFKKSRLPSISKFKFSEQTIVSDIPIEISDCDSDEEPLFNMEDAPSPSKRAKTDIGVHAPKGTSTPTNPNSATSENWIPRISNVHSLSCVTPQTQSSTASINSGSSSATVIYDHSLTDFDASTVPFSTPKTTVVNPEKTPAPDPIKRRLFDDINAAVPGPSGISTNSSVPGKSDVQNKAKKVRKPRKRKVEGNSLLNQPSVSDINASGDAKLKDKSTSNKSEAKKERKPRKKKIEENVSPVTNESTDKVKQVRKPRKKKIEDPTICKPVIQTAPNDHENGKINFANKSEGKNGKNPKPENPTLNQRGGVPDSIAKIHNVNSSEIIKTINKLKASKGITLTPIKSPVKNQLTTTHPSTSSANSQLASPPLQKKSIEKDTPRTIDISSVIVLISTGDKALADRQKEGEPNKKQANKLDNVVPRNTEPQPGTSKQFNISPNNPKKDSPISLQPKKGKDLNFKESEEFSRLFQMVENSRHLKSLLDDTENDILRKFKNMEDNEKYVLTKLFLYKQKWYNTTKFCATAKLEPDNRTDLFEIFQKLKKYELVDADYLTENMVDLLNQLDKPDLKDIMTNRRIKSTNSTKEEMINRIIMATKTQTTLTKRTLRDIIMIDIQKKLGFAVRIKQNVYNALYNVYVLATFSNPEFKEIRQYITHIFVYKTVFPEAHIEDFVIFNSKEQFVNYSNALKLSTNLDNILESKKGKWPLIEIAEEAYEKLKSINPNENIVNTPHLKKFTAAYVYVEILTTCCAHLYTKQTGKPELVKKRLEFLIHRFPESTRLGQWSLLLAKLHLRHLDLICHKTCAQVLIAALKTVNLDERIKYELALQAQALVSGRKQKIDQIYLDLLMKYMPRIIDPKSFPQNQIDSHSIKSRIQGRKRVYYLREDEQTILYSVEEVALRHYAEYDYPGGRHCEGTLVQALFTLFFWDIIYNQMKYIPETFVNKLQFEPLDMRCTSFYEKRKELIDSRLKEIESKWPLNKLIEIGASSWENHCEKTGPFGSVNQSIRDVETIEILVLVIGRKILAKIFERLVKNISRYSSGMPDLLVWNIDKKIHKFVEVKGEGDRLSPNQILWLQYLQEIGASIEVCHVHSKGSKRKKVDCNGAQKDGPSTSRVESEDDDDEFVEE